MNFQIIVYIVGCSLIAVSFGTPIPEGDDVHAKILRLENTNNGVDKYDFSYETSNGITRSENGELKTVEDGAAIVTSGRATWIAPDGNHYGIAFTADETGYHPTLTIESVL